jgi:hypothetical protein
VCECIAHAFDGGVGRDLVPILDYFRKQGAKGGKTAGTSLTEHMKAEERSEAARKAVLVGWERNRKDHN